jgi:uncharacterized membrane protein
MTQSELAARKRYVTVFNRLGLIAVFSAFAFLSTTFIRIPVPVSGGYFNIGDTFVMAAGVLFGPIIGGFVGLIGPTLSDAIGYPVFIPATAVIKLTEGLLVGAIGFRAKGASAAQCIIALVIGGATIVVGYFLFEAYIYPFLAKSSPFFDATNVAMAIGEVIPNSFQATISAILAFGMWKLLKGPASRATR